MQQMQQRLAHIEGRGETMRVDAKIRHELGKLSVEPIRENREKEGKISLHVALVSVDERGQPYSVIGEKQQDGVIQITRFLHRFHESSRRFIAHANLETCNMLHAIVNLYW